MILGSVVEEKGLVVEEMNMEIYYNGNIMMIGL